MASETIAIGFSKEELIEVLNHTGFTAFHSLEDDDEEAWRVAHVALRIIDKVIEAFPDYVESEHFMCAREIAVLRRRVEKRARPSA